DEVKRCHSLLSILSTGRLCIDLEIISQCYTLGGSGIRTD
uniref:Uncharacterized protein n=1 Tax=Aegilops tauschii subsp. strangulata TaxID=200361 RepID=A0A453FY18_AEGTS